MEVFKQQEYYEPFVWFPWEQLSAMWPMNETKYQDAHGVPQWVNTQSYPVNTKLTAGYTESNYDSHLL